MSDEQKPTGLALLRVPFPAHQISKLPKGGVMLDYVGYKVDDLRRIYRAKVGAAGEVEARSQAELVGERDGAAVGVEQEGEMKIAVSHMAY